MTQAQAITRTVQSSDLSRNSSAVFAATQAGPVTITRRDGETLVLTRQSEVEAQQVGLQLAAQLIAASLDDERIPFVDRLRRPFPWVEFLTEASREEFAREVVDVARACAAVARFDRLLVTLRAWQSTAEAIAAGYTADADLQWFDEAAEVADPRHA